MPKREKIFQRLFASFCKLLVGSVRTCEGAWAGRKFREKSWEGFYADHEKNGELFASIGLSALVVLFWVFGKKIIRKKKWNARSDRHKERPESKQQTKTLREDGRRRNMVCKPKQGTMKCGVFFYQKKTIAVTLGHARVQACTWVHVPRFFLAVSSCPLLLVVQRQRSDLIFFSLFCSLFCWTHGCSICLRTQVHVYVCVHVRLLCLQLVSRMKNVPL